jgi:hypothetical protein
MKCPGQFLETLYVGLTMFACWWACFAGREQSWIVQYGILILGSCTGACPTKYRSLCKVQVSGFTEQWRLEFCFDSLGL